MTYCVGISMISMCYGAGCANSVHLGVTSLGNMMVTGGLQIGIFQAANVQGTQKTPTPVAGGLSSRGWGGPPACHPAR
jgi:hypothetical protein